MPAALKVFLWSLVAGFSVGGFTLKAIFWIGARWADGDQERLGWVMVNSVVLSVAFGVAAAVAAGVVAGKKLRS
jgi:hypothetical protein